MGRYVTGVDIFRHPIVAGLLWWAVSGMALPTLPAAVFFELFWLDLFYVGTYVPPHSLFSLLLFLPLARIFGLEGAPECTVLLLAALPFAGVGAKIESLIRKLQGRKYLEITAAAEASAGMNPLLKRTIKHFLFRQFLYISLAYLFGFLVLAGAICLWKALIGPLPVLEFMNWGILCGLAAIGGLMALRIAWAYVAFGACVLVLGFFTIF